MLALSELNTFAKEKLSGRLQHSTERIVAEIEKREAVRTTAPRILVKFFN